jgi:dCTP deaminase
MILTGTQIKHEIESGNITVLPFQNSMINPNSINYRLGTTIKKFVEFDGNKNIFESIKIPESGFLLEPNTCYIANTLEVIGSSKYAMSLIGRSSLGRLGLFLQISANLGHTGCSHQWTLEIVATKPIILYPKMRIGQVSFWVNVGQKLEYQGIYGKISEPQESLYILPSS